MAQSNLLGGSLFLVATVIGSSVQADVTAEQVWQQWRDLSATMGQTISVGSENRSGGTLTLSGVEIGMAYPGGEFKGTLDEVVMRERGDGSVEITMSPEYPLHIKASGEGEEIDMQMLLRQSGMVVVASGDVDNTIYDIKGDEMAISVTEMIADGKAVPLVLNFVMSTLDGQYHVAGSDTRQIATTLNAGKMTFDVSAQDPDSDGKFTMSGELAQVAAISSGTYITGGDMSDMVKALREGFATEAAFTYGASSYTMDFDDKGDTMTARGTAESGALNVAIDASRLSYSGNAKGVDTVISGSSTPLPEVALKMGEYGFNFTIPATKSDTPNDYALLTKLVDFTINDEVWGMLDPAGVLPRDPATLIFDLSGKANWQVEIMDAEQIEKYDAKMPAEVHSLDVNEVKLSAAGAELTGAGGFTFDNTDFTTFDGIPKPTGSLDLKLVGGNGLMDKLVQMGLLPEDQAMGARMMMGLFARPGDGEDTLVSTIEVTPDGAVMANGQRLQ